MSFRFSNESKEEYETACLKELRRGFEGKNWMLLRVPPHYRESITENLKAQYPQYHFSTYEISGIWIYGDLAVNTTSAIRDFESYCLGIIRVYEPYTSQVCDKLNALYPSDKFSVEEYDGEKVISVNNHHLKIKQ